MQIHNQKGGQHLFTPQYVRMYVCTFKPGSKLQQAKRGETKKN